VSPPGKKPSLRSIAEEFVSRRAGNEIGQDAFDALRRELAASRGGTPPSRPAVLDLLLATGAELSRSIGGFAPDLRGRVHIGDLDSAQTSLVDMTREYAQARAAGDSLRAEDCRRAVQHGQQRLLFLLGRPNLSDEKRREKSELRDWFRVWLEAPELFPDWVVLRRHNAVN
jgi:hypothetical protein